MPWAPPKWLPLMLLGASIMGSCRNSVVDCAVCFNCLWHPVNRSCEGDTPSCCIVISIVVEHIYKPTLLAMHCIEGTAPTNWSVVNARTQPFGPNHWLCCRCRNWRRFTMAIWTSARQTKRKMIVSLFNARAHRRLYSGRCSHSQVCVSVGVGVEIDISWCTVGRRNLGRFSVAMLTSTRQTKWMCSSWFPLKHKRL